MISVSCKAAADYETLSEVDPKKWFLIASLIEPIIYKTLTEDDLYRMLKTDC